LPYTNRTNPIPPGMSDRNTHVGSRFMAYQAHGYLAAICFAYSLS
jgi:hypothetical protein